MLDKNGGLPLYVQIIDVLSAQILAQMSPHDKMMSEREICKKYSVSRTTVRQAMFELENMGYIYKRHGKGTYVGVLNREKQNMMSNYSFTNQMRESGKTPETQVLQYETVLANQYISNKMNVTLGSSLFYLKRLRLADGLPMMIESSYIPARIFPALSREMIDEKPLYEIFLEDYNKKIELVEEEISACIIGKSDARLLDIPSFSAGMHIKRLSYSAENIAVEFTLSTARSDQFVYRIKRPI